MKNIKIKLALFFVSLMCISSILSFCVSAFYTNSIANEIKLEQEAIATSILKLGQKTDLTVEEIINITSNSMYRVDVVENMSIVDINEDELKRIKDGEIVSLSSSGFQGSTVLMIDDSYIKISLHPTNNIFKLMASRIGFTLVSYVIIGACLIALLSKRAVKPILKLTYATKEVAKGNFDIQIENESNDEIGLLTDNFNKMTRELKSIEYLRKDFMSSVSHEFKTPIASIQGFAKLLQNDNLSNDEKNEYTNIIIEETSRLSNLSSNILKLSKLENQEIIENKNLFSLDEQIRKSILLLEHQWSKKNIEFDIELENVNYKGDEDLLQQVWINLLNNAIKFSNINGNIKVSLNKTDTSIKVEISDNGIGMSEETQLRIFEKFYQGDKSHSNEGNGLGLALVKRILYLFKGNIHVKSKLYEGSTFIVELPL